MSLLPSSARRNSGQRGAPHPLSAALSVLRGLRLRRLARSRLRPLGRLGVGLRLRPRLLRRARLRRHARCQLGALPERLPYPLTRAPGARDDSRTAVRKPARTRCTSRASTASTVPEERANGGTLCAGRCRSSDGAGGVGAGTAGAGAHPRLVRAQPQLRVAPRALRRRTDLLVVAAPRRLCSLLLRLCIGLCGTRTLSSHRMAHTVRYLTYIPTPAATAAPKATRAGAP